MEPEPTVAVVTVPFPAQGHLNQLLHLSLLLASRGLPVHYAAPEPHLREARARLHGWGGSCGGGSGGADDPHVLLAAVRFRALEVPAHASPAPDPASPFPTHMLPLFEAFCAGARAPFGKLLDELSATHRRVVVLHDRMAAFAAGEAARLPNAEALGVHCLAASYNVGWADPGHALLRDHGLVFHPPDACATREFVALARRMGQERRRAPGAGMVVNTCRALEGEFLDVLAGAGITFSSDGPKLFAVGPLNPVLLPPGATAGARHECLDWLDKQPPSSVLYVSFGTTSSLRHEQVRELAAALRDSRQRFVWVLRDADRADMRGEAAAESGARLLAVAASELGGGGGDATALGAGVVVTGWAPQLEILAHGATAAFMSHCGWNSTVESLSHGKPILAWPMHSDQPWDAELVCKYLGAGVLVRPWEQRHDVTPAAAIGEAIGRVMASDEGTEMRRRAAELGEAVRGAVAEGGSSRHDLEELVAYMTR
jgi:cis-zeatin O-glucosyltransferase